MEVVKNLSISEDGAMNLQVDADKVCYIVCPDGSVITSVGGAISTTWGGTAGKISLIIPKDSEILMIGSSDYVGELRTNFAGSFSAEACLSLSALLAPMATFVEAMGCTSLTVLSAPLATYVGAVDCALTAKSIGNQLIAFKNNNPTVAGTANFSGGTNALKSAIALYLIPVSDGDTTFLDDWIDLNLPNWVITFRTI